MSAAGGTWVLIIGLNKPRDSNPGAFAPGLFHAQLQFNVRQVGRVYQTGMRQIAFLFLGFFRKNVAFESVFSLDLTRTSDCEAFLRTGFCLHFRHFSFSLKSEHSIGFIQ